MSDEERETRVHPTAVVERGAELGQGAVVGPYCVVEAGAQLGDGCSLGPFVHVHRRAQIGEGTQVGTHCAIGGPPQDTKYAGEPTRVRIGDRCTLFEGVTVHRGTGEGTETVIGDDVMLMAGSHVGHNCVVEDGVVLVNDAMLGGHARVGERAFISGTAGVHQFCAVGRLTLIGGACMVVQDAPPFSIVVGSYPIRWRGLNKVGLRRAGFDAATRSALDRAFARLYRSGEGQRAVARELVGNAVPEVAELGRFVLDSKRGVCGADVGARRGSAGAE